MAFMGERDWQGVVRDLTTERDALAAEVRRLRGEANRVRGHEQVALMTLAHSSDAVARLEKQVRDLENDLAQEREKRRAVVEAWNELSDEPTGDPAFKVELIARLNELARATSREPSS